MSAIDGVGSIDTIYDCMNGNGVLVRLAKEIDLDELLLDLLAQGYGDREDWRFDEPTTLPGYSFIGHDREAHVAWFRKQPCACGEEHSWDMGFVANEKPEGSKARGAFLGVFLG